MDQAVYNSLSIYLSVITLVITIGGLYAVYFQIKKIKEAAWSNTHSKLCDQSFELLKFFSERPYTYDYFYNSKELSENDKHRVDVLYATEALANFLEHLVLQKDNLPLKQWQVWERFIYTTFKTSKVVSVFIRNHREWYSEYLLTIVDKCELLY